MNEPSAPHQDPNHSRDVIIAVTLVSLTCILSCAAVLITLILRTS
jgi:hypothetical protein